jgi:parvulin-like peptidyl-prolyl isomerase
VPTLGPSPTLNATEVREQFDENVTNFYENLSQQASISNETLDNYFEILALRKKLQEVVAPVGETTLYANARHILVLTQEEANSVIAALNAGESFAGLAITLSQDNGGSDPQSDGGSAAKGGELGWAPVGEYTTGYVPEFAKAIREAQIGQIVGPLQTQFGFHIIQVRAFEERDLTEQEIESAKARALDIWLEANRIGKFEIYDNWSAFIG